MSSLITHGVLLEKSHQLSQVLLSDLSWLWPLCFARTGIGVRQWLLLLCANGKP